MDKKMALMSVIKSGYKTQIACSSIKKQYEIRFSMKKTIAFFNLPSRTLMKYVVCYATKTTSPPMKNASQQGKKLMQEVLTVFSILVPFSLMKLK